MSIVTDAKEQFATLFPLAGAPLVQCITNTVTQPFMANALLYVGAKPVMTAETRLVPVCAAQSDAILLNAGLNSIEKEIAIRTAARYAHEHDLPFVLDIVSISLGDLSERLIHDVERDVPSIIKGNHSEVRRFLGMESAARGVDASAADSEKTALDELAHGMEQWSETHDSVLASTGAIDIVASHGESVRLANGVDWCGQFTGSGDLVGALMAGFLKTLSPFEAAIAAISYFNLAGERAQAQLSDEQGIESFRLHLMDQLSLLKNDAHWFDAIKEEL